MQKRGRVSQGCRLLGSHSRELCEAVSKFADNWQFAGGWAYHSERQHWPICFGFQTITFTHFLFFQGKKEILYIAKQFKKAQVQYDARKR